MYNSEPDPDFYTIPSPFSLCLPKILSLVKPFAIQVDSTVPYMSYMHPKYEVCIEPSIFEEFDVAIYDLKQNLLLKKIHCKKSIVQINIAILDLISKSRLETNEDQIQT